MADIQSVQRSYQEKTNLEAQISNVFREQNQGTREQMLTQFKEDLINYQATAQASALKSSMNSIKLSLFDRAKQQVLTVSAGRMSMLIAQSDDIID